jgi:hypothetical protein
LLGARTHFYDWGASLLWKTAMIIYIVEHSDYDDHSNVAVFLDREKAEARVEIEIEKEKARNKSNYDFMQKEYPDRNNEYLLRCGFGGYSVEEYEVIE